MKVEHELVDHPKYLLLKKRVGPDALEILIRLWGHCASNKRGELWRGASADYVEAVARWKKQDGTLFSALTEFGWVKQESDGIRIHDWEKTNWRAVSNWDLGSRDKKKGAASGKPRLVPVGSPTGSPLTELTELTELTDGAAVEVPSEDTVLKAAREYAGDMARGIPAVIPEGWALSWYAWRLTPAAGPFPADWVGDLTRRFRSGWVNGDPRTRGVQKKNGEKMAEVSASVQAVADNQRRREAVRELGLLRKEIESLRQAGAPVPADLKAREKELLTEVAE